MDEQKQILQKINEQEQKLDELIAQVNKVRKYFLIIVWVTIALFVFPLIGLMFFVPSFLDTYSSSLNGLI